MQSSFQDVIVLSFIGILLSGIAILIIKRRIKQISILSPIQWFIFVTTNIAAVYIVLYLITPTDLSSRAKTTSVL